MFTCVCWFEIWVTEKRCNSMHQWSTNVKKSPQCKSSKYWWKSTKAPRQPHSSRVSCAHSASSQQRAGLADRILLGLLVSAAPSSWWWLLASAKAGCFLTLLWLEAQQVKCMRTQTLTNIQNWHPMQQGQKVLMQDTELAKYSFSLVFSVDSIVVQ